MYLGIRSSLWLIGPPWSCPAAFQASLLFAASLTEHPSLHSVTRWCSHCRVWSCHPLPGILFPQSCATPSHFISEFMQFHFFREIFHNHSAQMLLSSPFILWPLHFSSCSSSLLRYFVFITYPSSWGSGFGVLWEESADCCVHFVHRPVLHGKAVKYCQQWYSGNTWWGKEFPFNFAYNYFA